MTRIVLLDGRPAGVEWAEAAGWSAFAHGWSVFETIRAREGHPLFLPRHLDRLQRGAVVLGLPMPPREGMEAACRQAASAAPRARLRLTLFDEHAALPSRGLSRTRWCVTGEEAPQSSREPLVLAIASVRRDERSPLSRIKCGSYATNIFARREALAAGAGEALLLNGAGRPAECATANLFAVIDGVVTTPPEEEGALAGIARGVVLEICAARGIAHAVRPLTLEEIARAGEVFVTSAVAGVQAVGRILGVGERPAPGATTRALEAAFEARES